MLCNSSNIQKPNYYAWRDVESQVQMPVTMNTIKKAIQMGLDVYKERDNRENQNIKKSKIKKKI